MDRSERHGQKNKEVNMSNTFIVDRPTESTHKEIAAALRIMAANARKELSDDWEGLAALADTGLFGEAV